MNSNQGDPPAGPPEPPKGAAEEDPSRTKTSGRTAFDARGNAVWEWKTETGQYTTDASTTVVRKLEDSGLAIESTVIVKKPEQPATKIEVPTGGRLQPLRSRCGQEGKDGGTTTSDTDQDRRAASDRGPRARHARQEGCSEPR